MENNPFKTIMEAATIISENVKDTNPEESKQLKDSVKELNKSFKEIEELAKGLKQFTK